MIYKGTTESFRASLRILFMDSVILIVLITLILAIPGVKAVVKRHSKEKQSAEAFIQEARVFKAKIVENVKKQPYEIRQKIAKDVQILFP